MPGKKPKTVDAYILAAPEETQKMLHELRAILKSVAPDAKETLKWDSPVFEEKQILFAYSAYKSHLNFMPTHSSMEPFKQELSGYTTGKDTIQYLIASLYPKALIKKIAAYRARDIRENDARWM